MAITIHIYYKGAGENARLFAYEMTKGGVVDAIRAEKGNLRYEYFFPMQDETTVLLIDSWESQFALDAYHASPMMAKITELREKYALTMTVERYVTDDGGIPERDKAFIV